MSKPPGFGPLHFRFPVAQVDRARVLSADLSASPLKDWPSEALFLEGNVEDPSTPVTLRPLFPGTIRFLASDPASVPSLEAIETDDKGKVTDKSLKDYALVGNLMVRLIDPKQITTMKKEGTIGALGESPNWALYGPVRLTPAFFRGALLKVNGLAAPIHESSKAKSVVIKPADPKWEQRAFRNFLAGLHEPPLRCGEALSQDDAERLPMPELVIDASGSFTFAMALGWLRSSELPSSPIDPDIEIVPAVPFLRHVGKKLREPVLNLPGDLLLAKVFEGEDTSGPWTDRLGEQLRAIGFGPLEGKTSVERALREFQIAATADLAATAITGADAEKVGSRDFRALVAVANSARYEGPNSGRANMETRACIRRWVDLGQRSPILISAFEWNAAKTEVAKDEIAKFNDVWDRYEVEDTKLRMFAADFTRVNAGKTIDEKGLEPIGQYSVITKKNIGGPGPLTITKASRSELAEFRPGRVGFDEKTLAEAKLGDKNYAAASTFRIIRAVSEIECLGYLDQINAYDDAGISFGPCHWSLGGLKKKGKKTKPTDDCKEEGELGGFATYLHYLDSLKSGQEVDVFASQGLMPLLSGKTTAEAAARSQSNAANKWPLGWIDDRGKSRPMTFADILEAVPTWRNFYRWVDIGRRHDDIGTAAWKMSLRRLHQLLSVGFPRNLLTPEHQKAMPKPTLGDIFTSELAVALLLRWHVKVPNTVVKTEKQKMGKTETLVVIVRENIRSVYNAAKATKPKDADGWQSALIEELKKVGTTVDAGFKKDFEEISERPWFKDGSRGYQLDQNLASLSVKDASFVLLGPHPGP